MVVLIVDAFEQGAGIANACDKLNVQKIHIYSPDALNLMKTMTEEVKLEIRKSLEKMNFKKLFDSNMPYSELLKESKKENIQAAIPGHELSVVFAEKIAYDLGLQVNDISKINLRRGKFEMQECLKENNLNYIDSIFTDDLDVAKSFLKKYKKIVLKPNSSAGSDSVLVTESEKEIENYFSTVLNAYNEMGEKNTKILVQEFIDGPEFQVNCISRNGKHKLQALGAYTHTKVANVDLPMYTRFLGGDYGHLDEIMDYISKVLDAFGVKIGATHSEVHLTKKGVVLMETATRMTGSFPPEDFMSKPFQVDPFEDVLRAYIDDDFFQKRLKQKYDPPFMFVDIVTLSFRAGKIKKIRTEENFKILKTFLGFAPPHNQKEAPITYDTASGIGRLRLCGKREDIEKDLAFYKTAEEHFPRLLLQLEGDDDELSTEEKNYLNSYSTI
ncbi:MAG: ATP-grasp domain-containing protein [Bifidobacteriaceae bacterium]|jgi:biotin carboxylase|nr:ATP-grasp domain-containing protein [Bifidobacteriaceae bacterium]